MKEPITSKRPPPGKLTDLGGYRLHHLLSGAGTPTVILEAGGISWSMDWHQIHHQVSGFTQVISYDRAGYGWSDPGPRPRHAQQMTKELALMLEQNDLQGPFILVGASFGGHIIRLFAHQHPDKVAGIILLDARHEEIDTRMPAAWKDLEKSALTQQRLMRFLSNWGALGLLGRLGGERVLPPALKQLPAELKETYLEVGYQPKYFDTSLAELEAVALSDQQVALTGTSNEIPLIVIRHGIPDLFARMSPDQAKKAEEVWQALQQDLTNLSSFSHLQVAEKSGHSIHFDQPQLVVEAIHHLVKQANKKNREQYAHY